MERKNNSNDDLNFRRLATAHESHNIEQISEAEDETTSRCTDTMPEFTEFDHDYDSDVTEDMNSISTKGPSFKIKDYLNYI